MKPAGPDPGGEIRKEWLRERSKWGCHRCLCSVKRPGLDVLRLFSLQPRAQRWWSGRDTLCSRSPLCLESRAPQISWERSQHGLALVALRCPIPWQTGQQLCACQGVRKNRRLSTPRQETRPGGRTCACASFVRGSPSGSRLLLAQGEMCVCFPAQPLAPSCRAAFPPCQWAECVCSCLLPQATSSSGGPLEMWCQNPVQGANHWHHGGQRCSSLSLTGSCWALGLHTHFRPAHSRTGDKT